MHDRAEDGFTLVELLVVVFIIGLLTVTVVMSLPPQAPPARQAASELAAAFERAGRESIASGDAVAWNASNQGYRFSRRRNGEWSAMPNGAKTFADTPVSMEIAYSNTLQVESADEQEAGTPIEQMFLIFTPTGETTGADIVFEDSELRMLVRVDEGGRVSLGREGTLN